MNPPPVPSDPDPRYRTVHLRVPVVSGRLVAAAVAGLLLVVAVVAAATHYGSYSRLSDARRYFAPSVQDVLTRSRGNLDQFENRLKDLNQALDQGLTAKSAKAIDVNSYTATQNNLEQQLDGIESGLASLDGKETEVRATYRIPDDAIVRTPAQQRDLDVLHQRIETDGAHLAALDDRIHNVAEHRLSLAEAEDQAAQASAAEAARLRRERAAEMAAQANSDGRSSNAVSAPATTTTVVQPAPVYAYPYPYYYGYGYPYYGGYYGGSSIYIGGYWGWGRGGWRGGGWHGGGRWHR